MKTIQDTENFVKELKRLNIIIDQDEYLERILEMITLVKRQYAANNESYIVEIPKEKFILWLHFKDHYQDIRYFLLNKAELKAEIEKAKQIPVYKLQNIQNAHI